MNGQDHRHAKDHTLRRLRQRYRFRPRHGGKFYAGLGAAIGSGIDAWLLYRESARTSHWAVRAVVRQTVWVYCVYNDSMGCVKTVLPPAGLMRFVDCLPVDQRESLRRFLADS